MTRTPTTHTCEALALGFFALMGEVPQSFDMTLAAAARCSARRAPAQHSDGTFKARPARVAAPLIVAAAKSQPHVRANATRAAAQRAKVLAVAAMLRAEAAGREVVF